MRTTKLHIGLLLPFFLLLLSTRTVGQNIASTVLIWKTDKSTDLKTPSAIPYQAEFRTNKTQTVEWIQKGGEKVTVYTVTGTEGSWPDVTKDGKFKYFLSRNNKAYVMSLEKNGAERTITFMFLSEGENPYTLSFHVQSVTKK